MIHGGTDLYCSRMCRAIMDDVEILNLLKVTGNSLCLSSAEIIEKQKKQIETLYKAIDILKHGYGFIRMGNE